ncbi:monocarboxylate transporter 12-like [Haliotis rubra]|uniref:monocarboxylate transporter 12-like n=1 Tax=Haliotis rubra TaxID=36100 RepID=UPI001EE52115|nr:monocarboxylate transporter 12-like [Haliotis rubra]
MIRDVNGGYWGLAIILSAFMIQFLAFGTGLSIGLYNIELLAITGDDAFSVSLVAAINTGCFLGSGPLASLLMNYLSHRTIVLIGAGLSSASILCVPFLPKHRLHVRSVGSGCRCVWIVGQVCMRYRLPVQLCGEWVQVCMRYRLHVHSVGNYMYALWGVGAGVGFCFVYVPSHVMSGLYYHKHTSLATGVATAGSGLGMTVFPIIVGYLIEVYTWRGSLIIVAGLMLNLFVFGLLLRPLPRPKKKIEDETMLENTEEKSNHDNETKEKRFRHFFGFCVFEFDVFFVSNIMWNMGLNMVVTFGPDFILTSLGITSIEAAYMLTVLGLCTFLGSLVTGFIGNFRWMNRIFLYVLVCLLAGIGVICFPVAKTYGTMVMLHGVVGLGFGGILGLLLILTSDLLGPENLGDGVGYLMLSNGVGCFAGPPIAGLLKDSFGIYDLALYTAGALVLASGVIMLLVPLKTKLTGSAIYSKDTEEEVAQGS